MTIDRDEKCAFCGFPRHAHWGGPQAMVAGRCAGFESSAATKLNAADPELLEALKALLQIVLDMRSDDEFDAISNDAGGILFGDICSGVIEASETAIAKAEGRL